MTEKQAFEILINDGWNTDGAFAILDELQEALETMTEQELLEVSEDYKDR